MSEPELTPAIAAKLFGPRDLNEPEVEPEVEGLPSRDKPPSEWTEAERVAAHQSFDHAMNEKAKAEEREQQEHEARLREEAMRTPEQIHNDTVNQMVGHGSKREATPR